MARANFTAKTTCILRDKLAEKIINKHLESPAKDTHILNSVATAVLNGCRINHVAIARFFVDDLFPRLVDFTGFDQLDFRVNLVFGTVFNDLLCLWNTPDK